MKFCFFFPKNAWEKILKCACFPHREVKALIHISLSIFEPPKLLFESSVMIRTFLRETLQNMDSQASPIIQSHVQTWWRWRYLTYVCVVKIELSLFFALCGFIMFGLAQIFSILWDTKLKSLGTSDMLSYGTWSSYSPSYMPQRAIFKDVRSKQQH